MIAAPMVIVVILAIRLGVTAMVDIAAINIPMVTVGRLLTGNAVVGTVIVLVTDRTTAAITATLITGPPKSDFEPGGALSIG